MCYIQGSTTSDLAGLTMMQARCFLCLPGREKAGPSARAGRKAGWGRTQKRKAKTNPRSLEKANPHPSLSPILYSSLPPISLSPPLVMKTALLVLSLLSVASLASSSPSPARRQASSAAAGPDEVVLKLADLPAVVPSHEYGRLRKRTSAVRTPWAVLREGRGMRWGCMRQEVPQPCFGLPSLPSSDLRRVALAADADSTLPHSLPQLPHHVRSQQAAKALALAASEKA